jgi:hypothetical protein
MSDLGIEQKLNRLRQRVRFLQIVAKVNCKKAP